MGATVAGVSLLLSREFLLLVTTAIIITSPLAWFLANSWLQNFGYRTALDGWVLVEAGAAALLLVTVGFQAFRVASVNPLKVLREDQAGRSNELISPMVLHNGFDLVTFTGDNYLLIESLVDESRREGFGFVQRTIEEWTSGANRFSRTGEGLWGLVSGTELIGIGGLNVDPFIQDPGTGRVRHLYIRREYRRKGCATILMNTIIGQAKPHFHILRLFTDNPAAAALYERLGFEHLPGYKVSHLLYSLQGP